MKLALSWPTFWADAKAADILNIAQSLGAKLKRQGREMVGACPLGCARNDGFTVDVEKRIFLCRPSSASGDVIKMVEHVRGCSPTEAAEFLTGHSRPSGRHVETQIEREEANLRRAKTAALGAQRAATVARLDAVKLTRDGEAVGSILERAAPFAGSRGDDYLIERGAPLPRSMSRDLRIVDQLHYWGYADHTTEDVTLIAVLPAMIGLIRSLEREIVGVHITYLDPEGPRKWVAPWEVDLPKGLRRNPSKKLRKTVERLNGSMIRLGALGDTIVLGEGIETVGAYRRLGYAPEDAGYGVAMSLGNLSGGAVASSWRDPVKRTGSIPNGISDPCKPGVLLPPHVRRVILLGDGDSDQLSTLAAIRTAAHRYEREGREVIIHLAPEGEDFASMTGATA